MPSILTKYRKKRESNQKTDDIGSPGSRSASGSVKSGDAPQRKPSVGSADKPALSSPSGQPRSFTGPVPPSQQPQIVQNLPGVPGGVGYPPPVPSQGHQQQQHHQQPQPPQHYNGQGNQHSPQSYGQPGGGQLNPQSGYVSHQPLQHGTQQGHPHGMPVPSHGPNYRESPPQGYGPNGLAGGSQHQGPRYSPNMASSSQFRGSPGPGPGQVYPQTPPHHSPRAPQTLAQGLQQGTLQGGPLGHPQPHSQQTRGSNVQLQSQGIGPAHGHIGNGQEVSQDMNQAQKYGQGQVVPKDPAEVDRLREHDRHFQQRYRQQPAEAPAQYFEPPASDTPWAEWQIRRACPSARFGHSANYIAARDGELFIMGGIRDMDILADLWVVDTNMLTGYQLVTEGATVGPRVGHASLVLGNAHVVFGGDTKVDETDPLDDNLYLLNTSSLKWTVAQPQGPRPSGRYGHSLSNVGSRVYVFGGQVDDKFYNDMWMFELTQWRSPTSQWELIKTQSPPPPRTNHTIITWRDKLYLFGGANGDLWYSDTWQFDPVTLEWTQLDCTGYVPAPCQGHAATIIGDVMYVFGGMSSQGNLIDQLFALKLPTLKWYTFQNLGPGPSPRSGHSLTAFDNDKILVWGGTDQANTAFVLDVSRINYPDDSSASGTAAEAANSSIASASSIAPSVVAPSVPPPGASSAAPSAASSVAPPAAPSGQLQPTPAPSGQLQPTSARSTPAARNSVLLGKRMSFLSGDPPSSPMRSPIRSPTRSAGHGQNAQSYISEVDAESADEKFQSAMDLPAATDSAENSALQSEANSAKNSSVSVTNASTTANQSNEAADSNKEHRGGAIAAVTGAVAAGAAALGFHGHRDSLESDHTMVGRPESLADSEIPPVPPTPNVPEVPEVLEVPGVSSIVQSGNQSAYGTSSNEVQVTGEHNGAMGKGDIDTSELDTMEKRALPRSQPQTNLAAASAAEPPIADEIPADRIIPEPGSATAAAGKHAAQPSLEFGGPILESRSLGEPAPIKQNLTDESPSLDAITSFNGTHIAVDSAPIEAPLTSPNLSSQVLKSTDRSLKASEGNVGNDANLNAAAAQPELKPSTVNKGSIEDNTHPPTGSETLPVELVDGSSGEAENGLHTPTTPETPAVKEAVSVAGNGSLPQTSDDAVNSKQLSSKEATDDMAGKLDHFEAVEDSFGTRAELERLRVQNEQLVAEMDGHIRAISATRTTTEEALLRAQQREDELTRSQSEMSELQRQVAAAQEAQKHAETQLAQLQQAHGDLRSVHARALNRVSSKSGNTIVAGTEGIALGDQIGALVSQWKSFKTEHINAERANSELRHVEAELASTRRKLAAAPTAKDLDSLREELAKKHAEQLRSVQDSHSAELEHLKTHHKRELEGAQASYSSETNTLQSKLQGSHESEISNLRSAHDSELQDLQSTHATVLSKLQSDHERMASDLTEQLEQARQQHAELESEFSRAIEYSKTQQQALTRTREELKHSRAESQRLEEQLQEARMQAERTDADESTVSVGSTGGRHGQASLLVRDLRAQITILEEDRDELREQVMRLKKAALTRIEDDE